MKRLNTLITLLCVIISLCACQKEPAPSCDFYYLHPADQYSFGAEDGVLALERREIPVEEMPLEELLRLYLEGAVSPDFVSPFPKGTTLERITMDEGHLWVFLSEEYASLEDIQKTLAGVCFSRTCFSNCDVQYITIHSGEQSDTYSRSSFTTFDDSSSESQ